MFGHLSLSDSWSLLKLRAGKKPPPLETTLASLTDPGCRRKENQDRVGTLRLRDDGHDCMAGGHDNTAVVILSLLGGESLNAAKRPKVPVHTVPGPRA